MAGQNFDLTGYLQQVANDKRARKQDLRYQQKHDLEIAGLERGNEAGQRAEDSQSLNAAISSYRSQINKLKNDYKSISGATLTDQQAIGELMSDPKFQRVAEQYINSSPRVRDKMMQGRNDRDKYTDMISMNYVPGEGGQQHSVESIDPSLNDAGDTNQYGYYTPGKRDSGSWVPTMKTTEKGYLDTLAEYLPFTENKSSDPEDPVIQLSNEDIFNFIDGEQALNAGVDLNAATRHTNRLNRNLGDGVPLHTEAGIQQKMQQLRALGSKDQNERLADFDNTAPTSNRGLELERFRVAEKARVATETAAAAAKANYALKAQEQTAAQKKSLAETAQKEQFKIAGESRKIANAYLDKAVEIGDLDKVMVVGAQVNASGTLAQKIAQPHKEQEAFLNALYKKHDFGNTAWREFHDKGKGFWNTLLGKGQTAGKLDRTSTLKDRLKVIDTLAGQQLVPLDRDGEWAGNGVLMDDLSDAEREYITTELDQSTIRVIGKNGVSRLLNPADTAAVRAREQQLLNESMNANLKYGSRGGGI
jgi:hypothetical protein